jgi:PKD repeat protein
VRATGALVIGLAAFLLCFRAPARAQLDCQGEWQEFDLTGGAGTATQTAVGVDLSNNTYIATIVGDRLSIEILGPTQETKVSSIGGDDYSQGDPDFATTSLGVTYLTYSQLDSNAPGEGREIYLTDNQDQDFDDSVNISNNRVDDYAPQIVLGRSGEPHLAWAQRSGDATRVLYWNRSLREPQVVGAGDFPSIWVDVNRVVQLVYTRDNDLFHNSNRLGSFVEERAVVSTPMVPEATPSIGGDNDGNILVAYESRNSLYFTSAAPGLPFGSPRLLDTGGVIDPMMRVRGGGKLAIVYAKQGDIFYIVGQSTTLNLPPQRVVQTPEVESKPSLDFDHRGNLHVSFLRGGVHYLNNACAPTADFAVEPPGGEAPLRVRFRDLSSGDVQSWRWDFGDGSPVSTEPEPEHIYTTPGKYDVSLSITAIGDRSAMVIKEDAVFVQTPHNSLEIPDQIVLPGQGNIWFPVLATHESRIQGFQVMGTYDPNFLELIDHTLDFCSTQILAPEFLEVNFFETYFEVGCIFDFVAPFDSRRMAPNEDRRLINLVFNARVTAPQGAETEIALVNNRAISRIFNIFTVDGLSVLPALEESTVRVLPISPPLPRFFMRGDIDNNRRVEITDSIFLLNFLFLGGQRPRCIDAADIYDNGRVDISSAITLLNFLFLGGRPPAVPFPNLGLDPTPDPLPPCN